MIQQTASLNNTVPFLELQKSNCIYVAHSFKQLHLTHWYKCKPSLEQNTNYWGFDTGCSDWTDNTPGTSLGQMFPT